MWSGFDSGLSVICGLSLLLVLILATREFSLGSPVFPSPQKTTFSKFQFDVESAGAMGLSVVKDC